MNPRRGLVEKELKADHKSAKAVSSKPVFGQEQASPLVPKQVASTSAAGAPGKPGAPKISSTSGAASSNVLNGTQVATRLRVDEDTVREWVRRGFLKGTFQAIQLYELEKFKTSYPGEITRAQQSAPQPAPDSAPELKSGKKDRVKSGVSKPPDKQAAIPEKSVAKNSERPAEQVAAKGAEKVAKQPAASGMNPLMFLAVAVSAVREMLGGFGKRKPKEQSKIASSKVASASEGLSSRAKSKAAGDSSLESRRGETESAPYAEVRLRGVQADESVVASTATPPPPRASIVEPAASAPIPQESSLSSEVQGDRKGAPREAAKVDMPESPPSPPILKGPPLGSGSHVSNEPARVSVPERADSVNWLESSDSLELDIDLDAFRSEPPLNPLRSDVPSLSNDTSEDDAFMVFDDEISPTSTSFVGLFSDVSPPSGEEAKNAQGLSGIALAGPSNPDKPFEPEASTRDHRSSVPPWESFEEFLPVAEPPITPSVASRAPAVKPEAAVEPRAFEQARGLPKPGPGTGSENPLEGQRPRAHERMEAPLQGELDRISQELGSERARSSKLEDELAALRSAKAALSAELSELRLAHDDSQQRNQQLDEKLHRLERDQAEEAVAKSQLVALQQELAGALRQSLALSQKHEEELAALTARFEEQLTERCAQVRELEKSLAEARASLEGAESRQELRQDPADKQAQELEQQRQIFEQQISQLRQMQSQREQQFLALRGQMVQAQEQRDSQIVALRAQLVKAEELNDKGAEMGALREQIREVQGKLQQAELTLASTQREQTMQSQRWAKELQTAGSWVGKLTEAVAGKDKRIQELEAQAARMSSARPALSDSEAQAQLMAARVEVGSLKRSGEVAQLQVSKLEAQLQDSRSQTLAAQRELAMLRERLEKQMLEEKSPRESSAPQSGKRLSLNLSDSRAPGAPPDPDKKRDDNLG